MRAALTALLALHLVLTAVAPHVHLEPPGAHEPCAVCVSRTATAATSQVPDLAAPEAPLAEVVLAPGLAPVTGAPLGAVPGQSPPVA
jgi:hypothetical protein